MAKVLLIEDHVDIRRLIRISLGKGFELQEAEDGAAGLEAARRHKPDLVVLDVMMPGEIDGLGVLDAIRADPELRHTKVVMVTAKGQASDLEEGMRRGADAYLVKPFRTSELVDCIKTLLQSRQAG